MIQVKKPYLIQRGEIKRPLGKSKLLSEAVKMDYMGSAEFEFGSLPKSFRALEPMREHWQLHKVPEIMQGEHCLRVFCAMTEDHFKAAYLPYLLSMRNKPNELRLKEWSYFDVATMTDEDRYNNTDFWWDIRNHVMWSFDKKFMNHVQENVASSIDYMNEQAALRDKK